MTTYTVTDRHGEIIDRHLSLRDAAHEIMTCDGHDYEIRPEQDGDGFCLWTTVFSRSSPLGGRPMSKTDVWSLIDDAEAAADEIRRLVIRNAGLWQGCAVMTDDDYDKMLAEAAA